MKRLFSAPTTVNLELTEACNVRCRHCYNFWREKSQGVASLTAAQLDRVLDRLIEAQVFHVVLTGGEPFARFERLCQALARLRDANISVSVNSNLMLATDEKLAMLASLGVDHILTSLPSTDANECDWVMNGKGTLDKIVSGIVCARRNNIRISVNFVTTRHNYHKVYTAGQLIARYDGQKLFVTRAVPPVYCATDELANTYHLSPEEARKALDQALQVKEEFGLQIGTLVSYPLCFLADLEKYADFVGRGCPTQAGHRFSINADGTAHACVHEDEAYGNVLETSLAAIYQGSMRQWHDRRYHFSGCQGCSYIDLCESGCAMTALAHFGRQDAQDPLFVGPHAFTRRIHAQPTGDLLLRIGHGLEFLVPQRLRFRREDGFYLVNIRWGNSITVSEQIGKFLLAWQRAQEIFTIKDFCEGQRNDLAWLYLKDVVEAPSLNRTNASAALGLSLNPELLSVSPS